MSISFGSAITLLLDIQKITVVFSAANESCQPTASWKRRNSSIDSRNFQTNCYLRILKRNNDDDAVEHEHAMPFGDLVVLL